MNFSRLRTKTLLRVFRSVFAEDAAFLLAISIAAGFYAFEKGLPFAEYISVVLTVSVITAWIWLSFASGFARRGRFVVFSLVYWIVPQFVIIIHANRVIARDYNALLHTFSRFSEILVRNPLESVGELLNINVLVMGTALVILCELAFLSGFLYRKNCGEKQWYRSFREKYKI